MISPDKIDEWIQEVQERPSSAELIIRYIARRLSDLASRDEELTAQNIELLSGRKVDEYESRIASLEYQLNLLKRQLGGEVILPGEPVKVSPIQETLNLFVFNPLGKVIRLELDPGSISSGAQPARVGVEAEQEGSQLMLLAVPSQEELLFIFDSGRTVVHPVKDLPVNYGAELAWEGAFLEEPRIKEELVAIQSIARMPLYETCIQSSRRGYVKKLKVSSFTTHLAENYIGTGVKMPADKTLGLTFANKDGLFVMVSREGYIFSMPPGQLPTAIEGVIRLGISDHIVSAFMVDGDRSLMFLTQNGKAVHREANWLEPASSFKTRGQSILSKERREAGTRIVGAAAIEDTDWGVFLQSDGKVTLYELNDLLAAGSLPADRPDIQLVCFSVCKIPDTNQ